MLGMSQAPTYTRSAQFADDERDNAGGRSTVNTADVDGELDAISTSINALQANQELNQRDDGEIRDERVKMHTLASDVKALLSATTGNPRGEWVTATAYAVRDVITKSSSTYLAVTAHTSGVFATDLAAGKWMLISGFVATSTGNEYVTVTGTDSIVAISSNPAAAYVAGQMYTFVSAGANATTTVTLNVDGLGVKDVKKQGNTALAAGDIASGAVVAVIYDGAKFQVLGVTTMTSTGGTPIGAIQYFPVETSAQTITDPGGQVYLRTGTAIAYNSTNHAQMLALGLVRSDANHGLVPVAPNSRWWLPGTGLCYAATLPGSGGVRFLFSGSSANLLTDLTYFTNSIPVADAGQSVYGPQYHKGWFIWMVVSGTYVVTLWATKDGQTFNKYTLTGIAAPTSLNFISMAANGTQLLTAWQTGAAEVSVHAIEFNPSVPYARNGVFPATSVYQSAAASAVNLVPGPDGVMILDTNSTGIQFMYNDAAGITAAITLGSKGFDATYSVSLGLWIISGVGGHIATGTQGGTLTARTSGISETSGSPRLHCTPTGIIAWCSGTALTNAASYSTNGTTWTAIAGTTSSSSSASTALIVGRNFVTSIASPSSPYNVIGLATQQANGTLQFNDSAYFNSKYVYAAGQTSGSVFTSPDADSANFDYISSAYAASKAYNGIATLNSNLLIFGNTGALATTPDASTFTVQTTGIATATNSASYFLSKYWLSFANDAGNNVAYSSDMTTWTKAAATSSAMNCNGLATNGTVLVAAGATQLRYSTNGTSWTTCTGSVSGVTAIFYDSVGGRFVAIASPAAGGTTHPFYASTDGITWAAGTSLTSSPVCIFRRIFVSNSIYYAVAQPFPTGNPGSPYTSSCILSSSSSLFTSPGSIDTAMVQGLYLQSGSGYETPGILNAGPGNNEAVLLNWGHIRTVNGTYSQVIGTKARMTYQQSVGFLRVQ